MPKHRKEFQEYIKVADKPVVTLDLYRESPATAFLHAAVEAKCAAVLCLNHFKINSRGGYNQSATNAIQIINASLLAYVMSNFETYQKFFFAQLFEYSIYLKKFDVDKFIGNINNVIGRDISISLVGFSAYRENPHSVGLVLAENLKNWHNPEMVKKYFGAFNLEDEHGHKTSFYSNDDINDLIVLWQMRHSIVHNAGTITLPDSQKMISLNQYGGKSIILEEKFITEVVRKMHPLIKHSTERMKKVYMHNLLDTIPETTKQKIEKTFKVSSSCNVWLR